MMRLALFLAALALAVPALARDDGRYAVSDPDWESKAGHYRVKIEGEWYDVPEDAVITEPNRAGRAMVWPIKGWGGLTDEEKALHDQIKAKAEELESLFNQVKAGTPGRYKSLALTDLESSVMWAVKELTA